MGYHQPTEGERYQIRALLEADKSITEIAAWIVFGEKRFSAYKHANEFNPPLKFLFSADNSKY